mmetsp:Transcript_45714/g.93529  ORF Transcript_45714/g.93529 Transcript_45714/m.93529 type:complete len:154 (+) Transcript_45714:88-549(+)
MLPEGWTRWYEEPMRATTVPMAKKAGSKGNLQPEAILMSKKQKLIVIIECARRADTEEGEVERVAKNKWLKYQRLRGLIKAGLGSNGRDRSGWTILQLTFVIGVKLSLDEHVWRENLKVLEVEGSKADRFIKEAVAAALKATGTQLAARMSAQ